MKVKKAEESKDTDRQRQDAGKQTLSQCSTYDIVLRIHAYILQ